MLTPSSFKGREPRVTISKHPVDALSAAVAASYLTALSHLITLVQPTILGALADGYKLSALELGHVSAAFVGAFTVSSLSAPLWVRRVPWRGFSVFAAMSAAIALVVSGLAQANVSVLLIFGGLGVLTGALGAPAFASLGDTSDPNRSYSISAGVQSFASAVAAAPLTALVIPTYGVSGLFFTLAILLATALLVVPWLSNAGRPQTATQVQASNAPLYLKSAIPSVLALVALFLFAGGIYAFWFFAERIGVSRGSSAVLIGMSLSAGVVPAIIASAIMGWLGARISTLKWAIIGTVILLSAFAALQFPGDPAYFIANQLFAAGWGLAQPAYWAIARKADITGRIFVAAPAASGAAGVCIGLIAGPVVESGGYPGLIVLSSGLIVIAALGAFAAMGLGRIPAQQLASEA